MPVELYSHGHRSSDFTVTDIDLSLGIIVTIITSLPLLAAGILAVYPQVLVQLRGLPADEYAQALRAPAWFVVAIGGAVFLLSLIGLLRMLPGGDQVFINWPGGGPLFMVDAYTLWATLLLGGGMAAAAWVPAARRSLVPYSARPFALVLVLFWLVLLLLTSIRISGIITCWILLIAGTAALWYVLFRPPWRWQHMEVPLVLAVCGLLGLIGLLWLQALVPHGSNLTTFWTSLLQASPRATNGAVFFIAVGWLGPAVYLPYWLWVRREEQAMVWLPTALPVALAGNLALVHLLFLAFPPGSAVFNLAAGVEHLFLIRRVLNWMLAWGVLALLIGAGWLAYGLLLKQDRRPDALRPLSLAAAGWMLLALPLALLANNGRGIDGLLWLQLTWASLITVWLCANGLLAAITTRELGERATVLTALWLTLLALVACPFTAGFRGLSTFWGVLQQLHVPSLLLVVGLGVTAVSTGIGLPRWAARESSPAPRPGVAWGTLGPFAVAFLLVASGLLGDHFDPLITAIRHSLLQTLLP